MAIDLYASCPCGSGRKIKFCCRNLAPEIEKVQRMIEGGQRQACLTHVEGLLAKNPAHPFLSAVKLSLLRDFQRLDEAAAFAESLGPLVESNADISAEATLIDILKGADLPILYDDLQRTLECSGEEVTESVVEAIASVGMRAIFAEDLLPGIRYLNMYRTLVPDDREVQGLMRNLLDSRNLSPLMKQGLPLRELPAELNEAEAFQQIEEHTSWGRLRMALGVCQQVAERHPSVPEAVWNVASCAVYLGRKQLFEETIKRYIALEAINADDAIEAEALRQLILVRGDEFDEVEVEWQVHDTDRLIERLRSDDRTLPGETPEPEEGHAPARCAVVWFDRPQVTADREDLQWEELPMEMGQVLVYGRETDREPRLVIGGLRDEKWDTLVQQVTEVAGDAIGEKASEEVVGKTVRPPEFLPLNRPKPRDLSPIRAQELQLAYARREILNSWPDMRSAIFDGKSLSEAAADPQARVAAQAFILRAEIDFALNPEDTLWAELRTKLGLPQPEPIDPQGLDCYALSGVRFHRLEVEKLDAEQLRVVTYRILQIEYVLGTRKILPEAIRRAGESELPRLDVLYGKLAGVEPDPEKARELLAKASEVARENNVSCSAWDMQMVYNRMYASDTEGIEDTMRHLMTHHREEPAVQQFLMNVMQYAASQGGGEMPMPEGAGVGTEAPAAPTSGGLWMPGESTPPPTKDSGSGSKLWVPD